MKNKGILILLIIVIIVIVGVIACNVASNGKNENSTDVTTSEQYYSMEYKGVDVTPGKAFDETAISEEYDYSEITSCAFDGMDKVYTYSGVEIDVAEIDGEDVVYYVYFMDTETETPEGIKVSDSKEDMINAYGEDYESATETSYTYTKENVILSFIVENDIITSIEYTLDINN